MPLKYTITAKKYDDKVLENTERGDSPVEKMLGIIWNLEDDTIIALPRYNLYGSNRGKELVPFLKDMTSQQILDTPVSRLTLLRITAQTYCKLQNLLGPLVMSTKAL